MNNVLNKILKILFKFKIQSKYLNCIYLMKNMLYFTEDILLERYKIFKKHCHIKLDFTIDEKLSFFC